MALVAPDRAPAREAPVATPEARDAPAAPAAPPPPPQAVAKISLRYENLPTYVTASSRGSARDRRRSRAAARA